MKETTSVCVEIKEIEPTVFKALLQFIYTDMVSELDENKKTMTAMAQHLLVAAHRYGLERLKVICERKIAHRIDCDTVASVLALAEQHGCSQLKAKCVEYIAGGSTANLRSILATEGFKHLQATSPSVLTELLMAAQQKINK
ncbi:hypothetical protein QOZ80_5AG0391060 [Eleusine coracana subsp. coracana]|nr:hypothetical protein QOZ80_5AG0391060 [Eleusine coracana subsp. coracana]